MLLKLLLVAAGGALGAASRFALGTWLDGRAAGRFPVGTLAVNALGCLVLGALVAVFSTTPVDPARSRWLLVLGPGFLGGFTTFSAFSAETLALVQSGRGAAALVNVALNLGAGLGAGLLGASLAQRWLD